MKFRKLESEDLVKENIVGKWIKDSNKNVAVKVKDYYEHCCEPYNIVSFDNEYLNYGWTVDEYMLIRDFDIEE